MGKHDAPCDRVIWRAVRFVGREFPVRVGNYKLLEQLRDRFLLKYLHTFSTF